MDFETRLAAHSGWLETLALIELVFIALALVDVTLNFATQRRGALRENAANIATAVGYALAEATALGLVFYIGLLAVEPFALWQLPMTPLTWLAAIVAVDFLYYWEHRIEHGVRVLWSYHSVHHSSPEFDLTTAYRLSWIESLVVWIFYAPMVIFGFDVVQTVIAFAVMTTYQTWIHTRRIGRLGPLEGWLNTPSAHRVHHGRNREYLDKNYGGVLMVWDRLFGTYESERAPVEFGITKPLGSANPLTIQFRELASIARDCMRAKSAAELRRSVLGHPG